MLRIFFKILSLMADIRSLRSPRAALTRQLRKQVYKAARRIR
jgi:hypothetical protein